MKNTFFQSMRVSASIAVASLMLSVPAFSQTAGVANIAGVVTDTTGASVAGATVTITNTDTGVVRTTTTNDRGEYLSQFLQPGQYEVVIGGGNFGKIDRKNLALTVGQTMTVDAALPAANVSTDIIVTSDTPLLDTEKVEVSQTIDRNVIENLPVSTRNWSAFVLLTPNVAQDGGSGLVSFHGISGLYNQNYVDGGNNNEMLFSEARGRASGAPYVYSLDSIKEFQAATSNSTVEFGQSAGGQVNAITKSGTNQFHGDAFYYLRYPDLNALDPYNKFQALHNNGNAFLLTQPIHQQHQFGGSVGGPIIKDRLFFFFTYDGFRRVGKVLYTDSNTISLTPTLGNTAGTIITPQQCPTTLTGGPKTTATVDPTAGASGTQCANAIKFIQANAIGAPGRYAKQNLFFPRLDFHINHANDGFVNYNFVNFDSTYGYSSSNTFSNSSPSTNAPTSYHERFLVAGLTTQVSNSAVNQFHFQFGRDLETAGANAPGPSVGMGVFTYGMPNALPRLAEPDEHRIQFSDVFSWTKGHHTLKFGGDVNLVHEVMINLFQGGGIYSYGGSTNAANFTSWASDVFAGQPGNTDPYAGYHYNTLVQTVDQVNKGNRAGADDFWMKMYDGFAEDNWKITPHFNLTAGVRYDIQVTPAPGLVNNLFAPLSTTYTSTIKNVSRVQPRIGFSWEPHPGTVVRGGYGIYSALNQGSTYYAMRVENGVVQLNYSYGGCNQSVGPTPAGAASPNTCTTVPTTRLRFPNLPFTPTGPALAGSLTPAGGTVPQVTPLSTSASYSFHGLDPNFAPPYAHEAEFSVEQALPGKMTLSVGYVGTRGMRLPVFLDANLIGQKPTGARTYNLLNADNTLKSQLTVPVYQVSDRKQPGLASFNTGFSIANTWYNSLAATLRRPFQNGLEVLMNYTWSRATDTGQVQGNFGTFYGGDTPLDPNNLKIENGLSDIDIRNRMTLIVSYQPMLFKDNKVVKLLLDDFKFTASEIASAGQPISLGMSGTVYSNGAVTNGIAGDQGNIYGGAMSSSSGSSTTGRPPQIGRNSIVGPGFNNVDLRISRIIPIWEKVKFEISADAFNLLNHTIITGVNGTHSVYNTVAAPTTTTPNPACNVNTQSAGKAGAPLQGCIAPFTGTGLSAFGAASGTNNLLYGPRQMQFSGKLTF